jgi:seryl-tRNA synthetase
VDADDIATRLSRLELDVRSLMATNRGHQAQIAALDREITQAAQRAQSDTDELKGMVSDLRAMIERRDTADRQTRLMIALAVAAPVLSILFDVLG